MIANRTIRRKDNRMETISGGGVDAYGKWVCWKGLPISVEAKVLTRLIGVVCSPVALNGWAGDSPYMMEVVSQCS